MPMDQETFVSVALAPSQKLAWEEREKYRIFKVWVPASMPLTREKLQLESII